MAAKRKRPGATTTFSVSVDAGTKRALRALADDQFAGNMSALITSLAEDARRRLAAGEFLRAKGIAPLTERESHAVQLEISREVAARKRARKRKAA
jgi:hypothetical protein